MKAEKTGAGENRLAVHGALWEADLKHGIVSYGRFAMNGMGLEKRIERAGGFVGAVTLPDIGIAGSIDPEVTSSAKTPSPPIATEPRGNPVLAGPARKGGVMAGVPDVMRAVVLEGHGGLETLVFHDDWPVPKPGPHEVLIDVHACGLNNTDVNTRSGWYSKAVRAATTGGAYQEADESDPTWGGAPITFPRIQGADVVGEVVAAGEAADDGLIGRRVMADCWLRDWNDPEGKDAVGYFGSECDGGFADYTTIDHRNVRPVGSALSSAELATFSCSCTTAENMLQRAGVGAGDVVLITGASGGVGSALILLANRRGAVTVAMASAAKHDQLAPLKPDALLDRAPGDLAAALDQAIGRDKVTVVADIVGGPCWPKLIDVLARGGRYDCSGAIAGPLVELDLRTLYLNDLTFHGCTIIGLEVFPDLVGYIERGEIRPLLAKTYPLQQLREAQQAFIDKRHVGNIVVTMD